MRVTRCAAAAVLAFGLPFAVASPAGAQTLTCAGEEATIAGTDADDSLTGTPGRDVIQAGPGDDTVGGVEGDDLVCGGTGEDAVDGGEGRDTCFGEDKGVAADPGDLLENCEIVGGA